MADQKLRFGLCKPESYEFSDRPKAGLIGVAFQCETYLTVLERLIVNGQVMHEIIPRVTTLPKGSNYNARDTLWQFYKESCKNFDGWKKKSGVHSDGTVTLSLANRHEKFFGLYTSSEFGDSASYQKEQHGRLEEVVELLLWCE